MQLQSRWHLPVQSSWTRVNSCAEGMLCSVSCVQCHDMHSIGAGSVLVQAYPDSTVQAAFISNQHVLKSRMTDLWEHPLQAAELWLHGRILAGQPVKVIVLQLHSELSILGGRNSTDWCHQIVVQLVY